MILDHQSGYRRANGEVFSNRPASWAIQTRRELIGINRERERERDGAVEAAIADADDQVGLMAIADLRRVDDARQTDSTSSWIDGIKPGVVARDDRIGQGIIFRVGCLHNRQNGASAQTTKHRQSTRISGRSSGGRHLVNVGDTQHHWDDGCAALGVANSDLKVNFRRALVIEIGPRQSQCPSLAIDANRGIGQIAQGIHNDTALRIGCSDSANRFTDGTVLWHRVGRRGGKDRRLVYIANIHNQFKISTQAQIVSDTQTKAVTNNALTGRYGGGFVVGYGSALTGGYGGGQAGRCSDGFAIEYNGALTGGCDSDLIVKRSGGL